LSTTLTLVAAAAWSAESGAAAEGLEVVIVSETLCSEAAWTLGTEKTPINSSNSGTTNNLFMNLIFTTMLNMQNL
jgi:hypothetical protein